MRIFNPESCFVCVHYLKAKSFLTGSSKHRYKTLQNMQYYRKEISIEKLL